MSFLSTLPQRVVRVYMPLALIVFVLLFPFYWMTMTAIKPKEHLLDLDAHNPFFTLTPTFEHIHDLLFKTDYPLWLWNTMFIAVSATILSLIASVFAAYAITRIRYKGAQWVGGGIFLAYLVPPSILFIPLSTVVFQYGLFDTPFALILTYPTILIPFSTWLLDGLLQDHPLRARRVRADGRRQPLADPHQDRAAARGAGADLGLHLLPDAVLERVHLRADLHQQHREEDGAGGDPVGLHRRRPVPLGLADGRRAGRLAAAGDPVRVLRRALRERDDGRGEGIAIAMGKRAAKGFKCGVCGQWHDHLMTDLACRLPDEVFALPYIERYQRARFNDDLCTLDGKRYFIRGILPVPFTYIDDFFAWGVWVEVAKKDHDAYASHFRKASGAGAHLHGRTR